jgi:hypothetical protein
VKTDELFDFEAILSAKDINKIRDLAEVPDLSLDLQRKLFAYPDVEVQNSIVKKIQDKSIIDSVLASGDLMAIRWAVRNPLVTREQLAQATEIAQTDVLGAIASNEKSDLAILKRCVEISRKVELPFYIYCEIFANPNVTSDLIQEIYDEFGIPEPSNFRYDSYLESLAASPKTPISILNTLVTDRWSIPSLSFAIALINNPSITLDVQRKVFLVGWISIRDAIARADGTRPELLQEIIDSNETNLKEAMVWRTTLTKDLFEKLFTDSEAKVRAAFGRRNDLTTAQVMTMVKDKSAIVREAIAYYDVEDLSLLEPLIEDTSAKVSNALRSGKKRDKSAPFHLEAFIDAPERQSFAELAATQYKSGVKTKKKPISIGDKVGFIKVEELTQARYEELEKDESVTLRVAGVMRGHELGLIDLQTAVRLLDLQGGVGTAPREAWLKDRALNWQSIQLLSVLDMQLWFRSSVEDLLDKRNELPEDFLLRVLKIHYGKYNWLVYENQKLTKACLLALVDTEMFFWSKEAGSFVQIAMLSHPLMDTDVYMALTGCKFKAVRGALYSAEKTPIEILRLGLEDKDGEIRGGVIANPRFKYSDVEEFLKERGFASKIGVLRRSDCPPEVLAEFAANKQLEIRTTVAANPSTPVDSLLILAGDEDSIVRRLASKNPSATPEVKAVASLLN